LENSSRRLLQKYIRRRGWSLSNVDTGDAYFEDHAGNRRACNLTSAIVWGLCDGTREGREIAATIAAAYPEAAAQIEADVDACLGDLEANRLIGGVYPAAMTSRKSRNDQTDTVFVALASYCEPELRLTIEDCLAKAQHPENLRFGICLQYDNAGEAAIREDCIDDYLEDPRFRVVKFDYRDSQGGSWARHQVQRLYAGEAYTLQVDAHSRFIPRWDRLLIDMLERMPSDKPLITSFPPLYFMKEGVESYRNLDEPRRVGTVVVESWNDAGWIRHVTRNIPENTALPRRTRLLSGALVFTRGDWNLEVMQDPEQYYTGEEFALTLRSYTWGYDLFDPEHVVVWHRSHPAPNRKHFRDNENARVHRQNDLAYSRLRTLLAGDPRGELGRFTLGQLRDLESYRVFSGLDCARRTIHPDARRGVPPDPVTIRSDGGLFDITVYLEDLEPIEMRCDQDNPVLAMLLQALHENARSDPRDQDPLLYLIIGEEGGQALYFRRSQLIAMETSPPLTLENS